MALPGGVEYAICNHHVLAAFRYSCRHFNDWVIVFKIQNNQLTVYEIIHGSLLY
ncbi:hypothetical protein [Mucilaginibacter oryzae]|uniref:hypothetical protein n=1 Tax=Mucilaginibacter oryzae TaxID=468058 RepID=UPI001473D1D2|nr:hypothetical protein [Mucilaginibacter oryzae]